VKSGRLLGPVSKPVVDDGDLEGGFVADGELVVPGGHGTVPFEPVDAALDGVALPVVKRAERGRPATPAAPVLAVTDLVGLLRNRATDTASTQVGAVGARAVGIVGPHPVRPCARTTAPILGTLIFSKTGWN
jgi:hypothetical protein